MPSRVKVKSKPGINFNINLKLNFSISSTIDNQIDFTTACFNNNITITKQLNKFFYELLNIKNDKEFYTIMKEPREYTKKYIKTLIKKNVGENNFSQLMKKKMEQYVKKNN